MERKKGVLHVSENVSVVFKVWEFFIFKIFELIKL